MDHNSAVWRVRSNQNQSLFSAHIMHLRGVLLAVCGDETEADMALRAKPSPPCIIASQLSLNQPKSVRICLTLIKSTKLDFFFLKEHFLLVLEQNGSSCFVRKKRKKKKKQYYSYRSGGICTGLPGGKGYALSVVSAWGQRRRELVYKLEAKSVK